MAEGVSAGAFDRDPSASASASASRLTSSFVKVGDRTRFTVELRPGETTIVSWKKLVKDAAKADHASSSATATAATPSSTAAAAAPVPPSNSHPALESRLSPGQVAVIDKDAPQSNRFSAVIEKIERLYMGKDSSDEEDHDDNPDDDQYDTEDSFIDDAELDEYFEVDKSKTKHDGYFVNRGMLEKVEPSVSPSQQPKKRRRKEMAKATGDNDRGHNPNKHMKVRKKGAGKSALSVERNVLTTSHNPSVKSSEEMKFQTQSDASGTCHQKIGGDGKPLLDPSSLTSNGDASSSLPESSDKQKGSILAKHPSSKLKEASEFSDAAHVKNHGKDEYIHKPQSTKLNNIEEPVTVIQQKDKSGMRERLDLNLPDSKHTMQTVKASLTHKKEGSSVKPKANSLEKAIRELEKMVAESRPPAVDNQDGDASSQSIKRRLPREIKQKLAKVARLAHASSGKESKELLNRLMGILGHLIQIRTLKRHLKIMVNMSLSVKQEKDHKFQQIKKEVIEMIKTRVPSLISKASEQQSGGSGDFQESGHLDKALKGHLYMDATLEDKICDLYDIFVDGLDEDAAPQVRKLYAELAELWPRGVMDNHGIKRAICCAKERKRTLNDRNKDQEKVKRKKLGATKVEQIVRVEPSAAAQPQNTDLRLTTEPNMALATQQNRLVPGATSGAAMTATGPMTVGPPMSIPSTYLPNFERPRPEKVKETHNTSLTDIRVVDGMVVKKKVKRKAERLSGEVLGRPEKVSSHQGDDKPKQQKHSVVHLQVPPHKSSYDEFRFEPLT